MFTLTHFLQDIDTSVALLKEFERRFKTGEARHAHQLNNKNNIDFSSLREITTLHIILDP